MAVRVRHGAKSVTLDKATFVQRFQAGMQAPPFKAHGEDIRRLAQVAWTAYREGKRSPNTRRAGAAFADPAYELSVDWLAARDAIRRAEAQHRARAAPTRILLINASPRSDQTCPGEISKTLRLADVARNTLRRHRRVDVDFLDLSRLASEYGRVIYPCKACVSTAMPLCHWPCSCYPNHSLGQVNDWMAEIYPLWVAAHGVMIVTPVHWYQAPSVLKLMIDRLVCADGGNPDPTTTGGKDAARAKALELRGWPYPRHLAGRVFSVIVHGDAAGADSLRQNLTDWLLDMGLTSAGRKACLSAYIGFGTPYATSHRELDHDRALQLEVRNAALALLEAVRLRRDGKLGEPGRALREPRPK
ncbi:MAG TPA: NAD(P)H-dependent oxidoreductase [Vineibacter sp.]|nr:NAD(P)H-dependent oxidoreductase [Vineibacter sp.]